MKTNKFVYLCLLVVVLLNFFLFIFNVYNFIIFWILILIVFVINSMLRRKDERARRWKEAYKKRKGLHTH